MNEDDRHYIDGSKESAVDREDADSTSLFHLQIPGILSEDEITDELEKLGHWEVLYRGGVYRLTVSS